MHKDIFRLSIKSAGEGSIKDSIDRVIKSLNGVGQWKFEKNGDEYKLMVWKYSGLEHVDLRENLVQGIEATDEIENVEIKDYTQGT